MDFKKILFKTNSIDVEKALPDGVIFCNKDGKIQWVNDKAAELFNTSKMHLLTSNVNDFVENILNLITNAIIYDKSVITKLLNEEFYFDMTVKEIEEGYVLSFRDIILDNNSKQYGVSKYNNINRDKNLFLLKLVNDLKSPLQSIVGFAQAMSDGLGGTMTEQQEKYIKIIKKNSADLMYFTDKLLELSRTELLEANVDFKTFEIANLVNSVVKYNEQLYKGKEFKWTVLTDENHKNTIVTDENILRNIIQGILEVILKSVDMGEISITISEPTDEILSAKSLNGDFTMISIKSSSLLLSENDLESMFDPYKIIDSPNRKNLLRAMTLASVKNLVQLLKGQIWVESLLLKNTSFNILIPQIK
ncbi:PAS domain-containing protein [bacterium]|nr:PAS domain-containing protein [bacterium]